MPKADVDCTEELHCRSWHAICAPLLQQQAGLFAGHRVVYSYPLVRRDCQVCNAIMVLGTSKSHRLCSSTLTCVAATQLPENFPVSGTSEMSGVFHALGEGASYSLRLIRGPCSVLLLGWLAVAFIPIRKFTGMACVHTDCSLNL